LKAFHLENLHNWTNFFQWARVVRLKLLPHPGIKHPKAIEADYQKKDGMLVLDV
jgi:hypothetical protein